MHRAGQVAGDLVRTGPDDEVFDPADPVLDVFQQRYLRAIHQDGAVFGVVDDVGQLVRRQSDVEGVDDAPHLRYAEVGLHMLVVVPTQRTHPIARLDAQGRQGIG